jgi:hypothetical protein
VRNGARINLGVKTVVCFELLLGKLTCEMGVVKTILNQDKIEYRRKLFSNYDVIIFSTF